MNNVIAAMEANAPSPDDVRSRSTWKFPAHRAPRGTSDRQRAGALKEQLEAVTGERISALEGIGEAVQPEREKDEKALPGVEPPGREAPVTALPEPNMEPVQEKAAEPESPTVEKPFEWELEL